MNLLGRTLPAPVLPREHGAWGIFFGSFLSCVAVTGSLHRSMLYLFLAMGILYCTRPTWILISRRKQRLSAVLWAAVLSAAGLLLLAQASSSYRPVLLWCAVVIPFPVMEILFVRSKKQLTLAAQIIGVVGLSTIAPLSHMIAEREASREAAALWIACAAFFTCGILFARLQIERLRRGSSPGTGLRREKRRLFIYLWILAAFLAGYAVASPDPAISPFAFIPTVAVSLLAGVGWFPVTSIRRTGWIIVAQTMLFVVLLAIPV